MLVLPATGRPDAARKWRVPEPDMQIINEVARRGFVVGWDPLKLGNALSCVASLFVLSRRTGVPSVYPFADRYSELFEGKRPLSAVHVSRMVDRQRLGDLLGRLNDTLETVPHIANVEGSSFEDLGRARVSGVVWFSQREGSLRDWRDGDAERHVRTFSRRGNGLVLQGSYWRQYLDMRLLRKDGDALRTHLGPVKLPPTLAAAQAHDPAPVYRIGLHLRLGDYRVWLDGRFYFEVEAYRSIAQRLHDEMGARPHVFFVVSDQTIGPEQFGDLPVETSNGDMFEDFARLSRCDLVVGPPSTFSTWAAFCGRAERIVLTRERIEAQEPLRAGAITIPFPTGAYLPGDPSAAPI